MPTVVLQPAQLSAEIPAGATLLDAGEAAGAEMVAGCLDGTCGTCALEVVSGAENLAAADRREREVLGGWNRNPARYRLACRARVLQGKVVVRQLD